MPRQLHLLRADSMALAGSVIATAAAQADATITVVILDGTAVPALPDGVRVLRLGENGLDHAGLLDLIFESDRVVSW